VAHIEFTVEPFVEGRPGPHVSAAIDAARAHGLDVDIGPFGSSCRVDVEQVGAVVAAVTDAALANGATHVNVHVGREAPTGPPAFELPREAQR
jgi:uncharacterized protein YqgV (UPF0045/DUF77 family)